MIYIVESTTQKTKHLVSFTPREVKADVSERSYSNFDKRLPIPTS